MNEHEEIHECKNTIVDSINKILFKELLVVGLEISWMRKDFIGSYFKIFLLLFNYKTEQFCEGFCE